MIREGEQLVVVPKKQVGEGVARSFEAKIRGKIFRGFVVKKGNSYFAYENLCQHLPVTLDLNDDNFFTHDRQKLQCHMHGAIYEIETGLCTEGPCVGSSLKSLRVVEEPSRLLIYVRSHGEK